MISACKSPLLKLPWQLLLFVTAVLLPVGVAQAQSFEAESGVLGGAARIASCSACSGGKKVGFIGNGSANTVTIAVNATSAGSHQMTVYYLVKGTRSFSISVNGGAATSLSLSGASFSTPVLHTNTTVNLKAGSNTIRFGNPSAFAPDLDRIVISGGTPPTPTPTPTPKGTPTPTPKPTPTPTPGGGGGGITRTHVYITFYGWPDNSPPGNAIAYPGTFHNVATAGGTWANPSTFASDAKDGEFKVGTIIYVPFLKKYFVNEDECTGSGPPIAGTGNCEADWEKNREYHVDLWLDGRPPVSTNTTLNCENSLTGFGTIIENPDPNRPVDTTPILSSSGVCEKLTPF